MRLEPTKKRSHNSGYFLVIVLCLMLSGWVLQACARKDPPTKMRSGGGAVPVTVATVVQKDVPLDIQAVGNVEAYLTISVKAQVGGELTRVYFREGDFVKKGDPLFEIDPRLLQAQLNQAQANLARDEAQLGQIEANLARDTAQAKYAQAEAVRYDSLLQHGLISKEQAEQVRASADASSATVHADEAALQSARATLGASRAAVENIKVQLGYTSIRSPIDGVIVNKALEVGEWVTPGTPILTVDDLSTIWARVDVQETDLGSIYVGKAAEVTLPTEPPATFTGRVMAVGQEGNFATERDVRRGRQDIRTFYVKVQVLQSEGELKPGMTAEVSFARRRDGTRLSRNNYKGPY